MEKNKIEIGGLPSGPVSRKIVIIGHNRNGWVVHFGL